MEENTNQTPQMQPMTQAPVQTAPVAGGAAPKKGKKTVGLFLLVVAIILVLGGGFYFLGKKGEGVMQASPTPAGIMVDEDFSTPEPLATETPEAEAVDKSAVKVDIQNGTGITGEASYLGDKLKLLGYSDITAGNASSQNNTTTNVTFSSSLSSEVVNEITDELKTIYQTVKTSKSSSLDVDVEIVTGLRKNQTSKPSSTNTPASPSPAPSSTVSPTPTSTS